MQEIYHAAVDIFHRTGSMMRKCIEKKLRSLDSNVYRSQHQLLMTLGANSNCSQNELAAILEISPAAVAVSLDKLEKNGCIARVTNREDRRSNRVSITEKGNQVITDSIAMFDEMEREMFAGFREEEIRTLYESLRKMYGNLNRMADEAAEK